MSERKIHPGTTVERWLMFEDEPNLRCQWPTADCAGIIAQKLADGESVAPAVVAAVLDAYRHLLTHPMGSQRAVSRLRQLRRAESRQRRRDPGYEQ